LFDVLPWRAGLAFGVFGTCLCNGLLDFAGLPLIVLPVFSILCQVSLEASNFCPATKVTKSAFSIG
jgi:hypothetical protein